MAPTGINTQFRGIDRFTGPGRHRGTLANAEFGPQNSFTIEAMTERDASETTPDEPSDPNDSEALRDKLRGQTTEHAKPPRLEDEGQSGG
jgi:hypothetical protein